MQRWKNVFLGQQSCLDVSSTHSVFLGATSLSHRCSVPCIRIQWACPCRSQPARWSCLELSQFCLGLNCWSRQMVLAERSWTSASGVHDRSMFFFLCKVLWSTNDPPWMIWMKVLKQQMWLDRVVAQGIDEKYWSQHLGHVATRDDGGGSWLSCRVSTEMPWIELKRTANASARYKLYLFSFHRFRRVCWGTKLTFDGICVLHLFPRLSKVQPVILYPDRKLNRPRLGSKPLRQAPALLSLLVHRVQFLKLSLLSPEHVNVKMKRGGSPDL